MGKSLKEQNNWKLWLALAINVLFFHTVVATGSVKLEELQGFFGQAASIIPAGAAGLLITVLNALVSSDLKATLVFWKWRYALPGHRSFSQYAPSDTRISLPKLSKMFKGNLPTLPAEQNAAWYKLFKTVQSNSVISDSHKTFLLLRDYTSISVLLTLTLAPAAFMMLENKHVGFAYGGLLLLQYLIVRQAAANVGVRMVTNVLALKTTSVRA